MNLKELAQHEAVLKTLHDAIGEQLKAVRVEVQAAIDEAAETTGVRQVDASLPDGTRVAKISLTESKPEARVVDADAFKAWVRANHPGEIERRMVTEVRAAFESKILGEMTAAGVPCDPATGELVPGVEFKATRARTHSVRFEKSGRDDVARAWRAGALAHLVLPALVAGDPEERAS